MVFYNCCSIICFPKAITYCQRANKCQKHFQIGERKLVHLFAGKTYMVWRRSVQREDIHNPGSGVSTALLWDHGSSSCMRCLKLVFGSWKGLKKTLISFQIRGIPLSEYHKSFEIFSFLQLFILQLVFFLCWFEEKLCFTNYESIWFNYDNFTGWNWTQSYISYPKLA